MALDKKFTDKASGKSCGPAGPSMLAQFSFTKTIWTPRSLRLSTKAPSIRHPQRSALQPERSVALRHNDLRPDRSSRTGRFFHHDIITLSTTAARVITIRNYGKNRTAGDWILWAMHPLHFGTLWGVPFELI
jgi:hypothetical protein